MAEVKGEDAASVSLGAGDHRGVDESQTEVRVSGEKCSRPLQITSIEIERETSRFNVGKEGIERRWTKFSLNHVGGFAQNSKRDDVRATVLLQDGSRSTVIPIVGREQG